MLAIGNRKVLMGDETDYYVRPRHRCSGAIELCILRTTVSSGMFAVVLSSPTDLCMTLLP